MVVLSTYRQLHKRASRSYQRCYLTGYVMMADSLSTAEEGLLLLLGQNNQVKYPSVIENVRHFDIYSLADEDQLQALYTLLEYSEQVSIITDTVGALVRNQSRVWALFVYCWRDCACSTNKSFHLTHLTLHSFHCTLTRQLARSTVGDQATG